jgi:DNA-binding NtrC family response regulator
VTVPTRLLYVEDDADLRAMVTDLLAAEGYEVVAHSTAEAAIAELERGRFPVFLTDYNLPQNNADWLLRVASERGLLLDTSVIVLSGAVNPHGIDGHQFLRKPVDIDILLATIEHALTDRLDRAAEDVVAVQDGADVVLKLYFAGVSIESRRAIRHLREVLSRYDPARIRLDVHDVSDRQASLVPLEEDHIVVTPTLVRKYPLPKLWILGDLSRLEIVEDMISAGMSGLP